MFAAIAALIALLAWGIIVLGGGLANPWPWLFAALFFACVQLAYSLPGVWPPRWHRGST